MITRKNSLAQVCVLGLMLLTVPVFSTELFAQPQDSSQQENFFEMSIEELMKVRLDVASRKESTQRESPGVVTVITRDQIQKSGARDLVDILRLVPGFDVGFDTVGAYGVGIRGIWANEGKVLVLMDGVELNDEMYSTFQYGHHIPVDIIDRIEIMRGPGSAMYGGSAELGVIHIKTMSPQKKTDLLASATYSRMNQRSGRKSMTGFYGTKRDDVSFSVASYYERGNFTDQTSNNYDYYGGQPVDLGDGDNSRVRPSFLNIGLNWGNLSIRGIIDRYSLYSPWPGYSMYKMRFYSDIVEAKYKLPITDNLSVTSKFLYKHQKPWNYPTVTYSGGSDVIKLTSEKYAGEVCFSYDMVGGHNIVAGLEYDEVRGRDTTRSGWLEDGTNKKSYYNMAFFGEGFFKTPYGNLTVGGRYVDHNFSGTDFVPRVAFTKVIGPYHIKALFSEAYRTPSVMNIAYNTDIKAEKTTIYELEAGAKVSENLLVTANVFDVKIRDPIVYSYSGSSSYDNFEKTGSRGVECSAMYKKDTTDVTLTYSYYKARDNKVDEYSIPNHNGLLLGFPAHKLSLLASFSPYKNLFITPSLTYVSPRYAVTDYGADYIYKKLESRILTNISLLYKDAFNRKGLDLSFSIYNLFDEDYDFIEPYLGWYGPVPGPSRSFVFKLTYRF